MAVSKDTGSVYNGKTWRVRCYYKDWRGERVRHEKRGFATRHEAVEYERNFLAKQTKDINMSFGSFIDIYLRDVQPQLKESTYANKVHIIEKHIRPYFKNLSVSEITSTHILQWQNELLINRDADGKGYSPTYLRTINNQINALFNHAVRYYDLPKNPCYAFKKMGRKTNKEMLFWTKDEYMKFSDAIKDKPISYYAFQLLYWTGIRSGELLALTSKDFDFEKRTLRINKTYQVVNGKELITTPKTEESNRTIDLPQFLCDEMQDYLDSLYRLDDKTRIFPISKHYLHHEMDRGCRKTGVKRIRIHDLRHSCCALLIYLGYSLVQIAVQLGHKVATVTEMYSHLYPTVMKDMASKMDEEFNRTKEQ